MPVSRAQLARFGAPAAFLACVTIVVLLVRAGLEGGGAGTRTARPARAPSAPATARAGTVSRTSTGVATAAAGPRYYTVRRGDTFSSIAAKEGTTVTALEALNPGVSSSALQVGQRIRVK